MPQRGPQLKPLIIAEARGDHLGFWEEVETAVSSGRAIWIRSPLLSPVANAIGRRIGKDLALLVSQTPKKSTDRWQRFADVLLSGIALIVFSPLLAVVSILVKLSSQGPVFYRATVVGKGKNPFVWHKFRSMTVTPESKDTAMRRERFEAFVRGQNDRSHADAPGKLVEEHRITRVGRLLRKFSVDELPQLWNVLKGDMSLVGPRPCLTYEAEFYSGWRGIRFRVRPGLTGIWQVFGRGRSSFDTTAAMDAYYIFRRSLRFNVYLIVKTVEMIFRARGAV